jgi:hypothetical protein
MRTALKYGLLITAGIAAWVLLKHFVVKHAVPPWLDGAVFNACELIGLAFGIQEQRTRQGGLTFREGVKTGLSIAVVYALAACLFFAILYGIVGPELLHQAQEPGRGGRSTSAVLADAFAGLLIGALFSGLVFSLLLSMLMRRGALQRTPTPGPGSR